MLRFQHVSKSYGPIRALVDLSMAVREGEIFGLLGPNGAGKTTTVSLAVGLLAPDGGTVDVRDAGPPTRPEVRARVGLAPQALALYDELSGVENLRFFGRLQGLRGRALADRAAWALAFVQLEERATSRVKTWSGGMQRRLNLAIALVHDPPLLLLDEPTVGVDPQSRNAILDKIQSLRNAGRTIVYTTHYMEEAQRLCDRVAIVDHGRLLALDTVENLLEQHGGLTQVVIETETGRHRLEVEDPLAELEKRRAAGGLRSFRIEEPNLEAVFLHLTGRSLRD